MMRKDKNLIWYFILMVYLVNLIKKYIAHLKKWELILNQNGEKWKIIFGSPSVAENYGFMGKLLEVASCYLSRELPHNDPLPAEVLSAQKKQIADDFPPIRRKLKNIRKNTVLDERFQRAWIREQKKLEYIPEIVSPETGQEIERFHFRYRWAMRLGSCFALPKDYNFVRDGDIAHNIAALHGFHRMLDSSNVQLIVVLIPDAGQIAARVLVPEVGRIGDLTALQCASTLLEFGIEAVYADDAVMAAIPASGRLFCYPDPRPETDLWKILAGLIARRLDRFGENTFQEKIPSHFSEHRGKSAFGDNYRWPEGVNCGDHKAGATVETLEVFRNGSPFRPDPASEILVIGGETLDLPGPGHSFTGQLSMRLKYPVDELALPGAVWFQNLALVLSRDPGRYLAGKKVCVLMLSPRRLADHVFTDVRKQSELYVRLRGQKRVHSFAIDPSRTDFPPPEPVPGERLYRKKLEWNRRWNLFSRNDPPTASVRIEETGKEQPWMSFKLPENPAKKPYTLVIEAAAYPLQAVTLLVNGQKVPLTVNPGNPHFRPCAAEIPPEAKTVEIKVSGQQNDLVLCRNVSLYQ